MVISVREFFSRGGLFEFLALIFCIKTKKLQKFTVDKVPIIDEIDELVGLNILLANFVENLLPPRDKQQHENNFKKTRHSWILQTCFGSCLYHLQCKLDNKFQ